MEFTPGNTSPLWEGTHLSKDALMCWRNHTLSPAQVVTASEHLAVCERCRDQLAAPSALLLLAQAMDNGGDGLALVRSPELQHLNFEQMEAFVDELLTPAGRRNVERHLALCELCSTQVADLRTVQRDLRDWQADSRILPEAVVGASTTANGTAPRPVTAPQSVPAPESTSAPAVPPMRVVLPSASGERRRTGWGDILRNVQRYLLPLETAGLAVTAVFLLLVVPYREELARVSAKYEIVASQKERADAALARGQSENNAKMEHLRNSVGVLDKQSATIQQKMRQFARDKAALSSQLNGTQSQLSAAQSKLEQAQLKLRDLEEQRRRDLERFTGHPSTRPPVEAPRPTSASQTAISSSNFGVRILPDGPNASILIPHDGPAVRVANVQKLPSDALRALSQGLQTPASVAALRKTAPSSKSAGPELHFSLLYPVGTRVREVRPLLRWEAVPGATAYRLTLTDETDDEAPLLKSDLLTQPRWQPEESLVRGHRYSWRVEAFKQDQSAGVSHRFADAPHKPDLAGNFELLSQAQEDALRAQLDAVKDSPLQKSLILAKAGVMDEAEQQLFQVTGAKTPPSPKSH